MVRLASLALFLYLVTSARQPLDALLPVDLFMRLDPLAQIAASISARDPAPYLLWSLPLLLATALAGRFFCGWLCPMGATLDLLRFRRFNPPRFRRERGLRDLKYLLLLALILAAAAGLPLLALLDPISLLSRSFAAYLYPAFNAAATGLLFLLYDHGLLPDLAVWLDINLRGNLLPYEQPHIRLGWLFLALFVGVVALNAVAHRFWCRYLCPLGALLALTSRWSLLARRLAVLHTAGEMAGSTGAGKDASSGCGACGKCQAACRMGAVEPRSFAAEGSECVLCGECSTLCPDQAISYGGNTSLNGRYDPSRRRLLATGGIAVLGAASLRIDSPRQEVDPFLVRPPGARETDFLERCVRCGQCVKSCPSSGLQPSILQSGLEGLWSPVLVSRIGPCLYDCTTCGQVCPTSAIKALDLETKRQTIIGTAYIDQKRCIPWVDARNCIVCQELCPVSPKAVVLEDAEAVSEDGRRVTVKRPRIVRPRCIGCGICEYKCPLPGEAAIRVYRTGALLSETGDVAPSG